MEIRRKLVWDILLIAIIISTLYDIGSAANAISTKAAEIPTGGAEKTANVHLTTAEAYPSTDAESPNAHTVSEHNVEATTEPLAAHFDFEKPIHSAIIEETGGHNTTAKNEIETARTDENTLRTEADATASTPESTTSKKIEIAVDTTTADRKKTMRRTQAKAITRFRTDEALVASVEKENLLDGEESRSLKREVHKNSASSQRQTTLLIFLAALLQVFNY